MLRGSVLAPVAAFVLSLSGCATVTEFGAATAEHEKLLETAGFKVKAGDTPQRIEALNSLAPGRISRLGRGGSIYYVYADPDRCRCLWVGNEEQYQRYRRLETEVLVPHLDLVGVDAEPEWSLNMEPW